MPGPPQAYREFLRNECPSKQADSPSPADDTYGPGLSQRSSPKGGAAAGCMSATLSGASRSPSRSPHSSQHPSPSFQGSTELSSSANELFQMGLCQEPRPLPSTFTEAKDLRWSQGRASDGLTGLESSLAPQLSMAMCRAPWDTAFLPSGSFLS